MHPAQIQGGNGPSSGGPSPRLASINDTATMLGLSVPTIYRMISAEDGKLETVKLGRRHLVKISSIDRLLGEAA